MSPTKYLQAIFPIFDTKRTKEIFNVNPTIAPVRTEAKEVAIFVHQFNEKEIKEYTLNEIHECKSLLDSNYVTWINIDGLRKADVETISSMLDIHYLVIEDILSIGQRAKMPT
jgi:magnesium transporter